MNSYKWVMLVCFVISSALTPAIHLRNLKYPNPRTKIHGQITKVLLCCWVLAIVGLACGMYKDFSRTPPAPDFAFVIQSGEKGLPLDWGSIIHIPITNQSQRLTFSIWNIGNISADKATLDVQFPPAVRVVNFSGWKPLGGSIVKNDVIGPAPDSTYSTENESLLAVSNFFIGAPLMLDLTNFPLIRFSTILTAYARETGKKRIIIDFQRTNVSELSLAPGTASRGVFQR